MQNTTNGLLVAELDGHLRALAMINCTDFDYSAYAFTVRLDQGKLLESLSEHLKACLEEMRSEFEDIDFSDFILDTIERISPWIGHLEEALKILLLPDPFRQSKVIESEILETVRCQVAWHVMELIQSITSEFSNKEIFRVEYASRDGSEGCFYIIPIEDDHLVLNFCKNKVE